jgi:hypothetical protein
MPDGITFQPEEAIEPISIELDDDFIQGVSNSIWESILTTQAQREGLDETLEYWFDLSEMVTEERNEPWPNAASLALPVTAGAMIDVRARLMSALFVKSPFIAQGITEEAAQHQEEISRFYNQLYYTKEFAQAIDDAINLVTRDGTAYIYVPFIREISEQSVVVAIPDLDDNGQPKIHPKTGKPKTKPDRQKKTVIVYNGPRPESFELADVLLVPATSQSANDANAIAIKVWLTETDLRDMVKNDGLWEDAVERIFSMTEPGIDEKDQTDNKATYELNGLINSSASTTSGPTTKEGKQVRIRGSMMFWLYFTREFDLNGDGQAEINVAWYHETTNTLAGIGPFHYWMNRFPIAEFFLFRRAKRAYGRGVPELTRGLQEEASALENQRLDYGDLILTPTRYHRRNVEIPENGGYGPNVDYEVDNPDDIGFIVPNIPPPQFSQQEQQQLELKAKALVGVMTPGLATPSGAKVSAKQAAAWTQSQNIILDLVAMGLRWSLKEVLDMTHSLILQYGYLDIPEIPDENYIPTWQGAVNKIPLPPLEIMSLPYNLDVTGLTGGLDQEEQYHQMMTVYALLRQDPLVAGDLGKWWYVVKKVLEMLNIGPDIPNIIGSVDDAKQKQQQMEAAQKAKEDREFQLQIASHSKNPPAKQNGTSPQQPQPQNSQQLMVASNGASPSIK